MGRLIRTLCYSPLYSEQEHVIHVSLGVLSVPRTKLLHRSVNMSHSRSKLTRASNEVAFQITERFCDLDCDLFFSLGNDFNVKMLKELTRLPKNINVRTMQIIAK